MARKMAVMLIEDDQDLREATCETLEAAAFSVHTFGNAKAALENLDSISPDVILSDMRLPGMSGLDFLDVIRQQAPDIPFVLITGHGDVSSALRAMRAGAHDFLEKPCQPELVIDILRRAVAMRRLSQENEALRNRLATTIAPEDRLLGKAPVMVELRRRVAALGGLQVDLLIAGETGTGKELVARVLHAISARRNGPFVAVNCGALNQAEIDRELFGDTSVPGRLVRAEGGTLYLDELEAMPEALQVRLLRVVDAREISPLGMPPRQLDLRILGSVKGDPTQLVAQGKLRADLFHRFNAGALRLPPLRERPGDAEMLLEHFVAEATERHDLPVPNISTALLRQAAWYAWPGNVREVRTVAERLVIGLDVSLDEGLQERAVVSEGFDAAMEGFESRLLQAALLQAGGRKNDAASLLGIPRKRLYLRMRHHGLE
ncbi:sigma-54-dependent transcriptional regulator [Roseinatronobacter alkalisoli]|uniref:Sigma-54 dependent transcriptional regulator n=1 Tax=Roseinatronobacter alkalisoli TaxID=3028235 RepID=A0ABT5TAG2_9RHOB|nr:sigma-54 dependent transcriptional regulator [Roseinatronobacter sp. HJB301]MDD7971929.1 sigma-54 dependent transcriptional regulator [Roseinatronobacter sp. HJB301]